MLAPRPASGVWPRKAPTLFSRQQIAFPRSADRPGCARNRRSDRPWPPGLQQSDRRRTTEQGCRAGSRLLYCQEASARKSRVGGNFSISPISPAERLVLRQAAWRRRCGGSKSCGIISISSPVADKTGEDVRPARHRHGRNVAASYYPPRFPRHGSPAKIEPCSAIQATRYCPALSPPLTGTKNPIARTSRMGAHTCAERRPSGTP